MSNQRGDAQNYQNKKNEKNYNKNQQKFNNSNNSINEQNNQNQKQQEQQIQNATQLIGNQTNSQQQAQYQNQQQQNIKFQNSSSQNEMIKNNSYQQYQQPFFQQSSGKQSPAIKYPQKDNQQLQYQNQQNNSAIKYKQKNNSQKNEQKFKQDENKQYQDNNYKQKDEFDQEVKQEIIFDSKLNNVQEFNDQLYKSDQLSIISQNNQKLNQNQQNTGSKQNATLQEFEAIEKASRNGQDELMLELYEKLSKQKQIQVRQLNNALHATVEGCKSTITVESHINCINHLLSYGAMINSEKDSKTILMIAAQKGFIELVDEIINKDAPINHYDRNQMNSLHYAIDNQEENFDIVERLIEQGININQKTTEEGYTPFIIAVKRGHINIVKYLLKNGALINDADNLGNTSLHHACELGEKDIVQLIATEETYANICNVKNGNNLKAQDIIEQKIQKFQNLNSQSQSFQGQIQTSNLKFENSDGIQQKKNFYTYNEINIYLENIKKRVDENIEKNGADLMKEEQKKNDDKEKKQQKKQQSLEKADKKQQANKIKDQNSFISNKEDGDLINNQKKQKHGKNKQNRNQPKLEQEQQEQKNQEKIKEEQTLESTKQNRQKSDQKKTQSNNINQNMQESNVEDVSNKSNENQVLKKDCDNQQQDDQTEKNKQSISLEDFKQLFQNKPDEKQLETNFRKEDEKNKSQNNENNQRRESINQQQLAQQNQPNQFQNQIIQSNQLKNDVQIQSKNGVKLSQNENVQSNSQNSMILPVEQVSGFQNPVNHIQSQSFNKVNQNGNKKGKVQNSQQSQQFQPYNFVQPPQQIQKNQNDNILSQPSQIQQIQQLSGTTTQNVNIASNLQQQLDISGLQTQIALAGLFQNGINLQGLNLGIGFNQALQQSSPDQQDKMQIQQNLIHQHQISNINGQMPIKNLQFGQIQNNQNQSLDQSLMQNQIVQNQLIQKQNGNTPPVNQIPIQNQSINTQNNIHIGDINSLQIHNNQIPFIQYPQQLNQPNQMLFPNIQNNQQQINQNMLMSLNLNAQNNQIGHQQSQNLKLNILNPHQQILGMQNQNNFLNGQLQNNMMLNSLQDIPQNQSIINNQLQNLIPSSQQSQTNLQQNQMNQIMLKQQQQQQQIQFQKPQQSLPIRVDLDLSDEKSLNLFIYKQKYNMKKNDYFNLERRKIELEKDILNKDNEISRLKELNRKYLLHNQLKDQGLDDSINLQKLIYYHNQQVHLVNHFKEKYEKSQQFSIDLLNKSNEAIKLLKQINSKDNINEAKIDTTEKINVSNREVIDVSQNQFEVRKPAFQRQQEIPIINEKSNDEQINEIVQSIQNYDEQMEKTLEAKDSEELTQKLDQNEMTLKIINYELVKNIIQKEHQASNILLMEKRYEVPLIRPQIPDIKKLLSAHAYALLLTQYPNFEEIHTRHNIQQIHNILHNEILLFKQDANAIMREMAEVKQILINKVETIIKNCNPDYTIDVYGSHRTGLSMYWSDIDIVVNPFNMVNPNEALSYINDRLEKEKTTSNQWITNVNYKRKATVPVVTISCSLGNLMKQENVIFPKNPTYESIYEKTISVDITCSNYNIDMHFGHRHLGIECVELVQQYVKDCWLIEPLLLVLKQLLKVNGLNEPFKGGLSSYGVLLMIVGFLQWKRYDAPSDPKSQNLGEILLDFLSYFSSFDYINLQINCRRPDEYNQFNHYNREVIQPKQLIDVIPFPYQTQSPTILDPLKNDSNVTKSTYQFSEIQEIFKIAQQAACVGCYCNSHFSLSGVEAQNKQSQDLQNLEYLILSLVDDPSAQAGAVCQYLQSKQAGSPRLIQYQNIGLEQDNQIHVVLQNGEERIVPIESLYKPVFVEHSHQCDSILAKVIYSYAQIKTAKENSSVRMQN